MNLEEYEQELRRASAYVREKLGECDVGLVLGSGLSGFQDNFVKQSSVKYSSVPGMPTTTVKGHSGRIILGTLPDNRRVLCFSGRVHAYEGWSYERINFICRLAALCGCKLFILTNSSGGCLSGMTPGSIMVIQDHIRATNLDPLKDVYHDAAFVRRRKGTEPIYNAAMSTLAAASAKTLSIEIHRGVYHYSPGPTYETPAEVQAGIKLGAGAFGMSTVPEAEAAYAMGMEVFGMSMCTNMAAGLIDEELLHDDVTKVAKEAGPKFEKLLLKILSDLDMNAVMPPTRNPIASSRTPVVSEQKHDLLTPQEIIADARCLMESSIFEDEILSIVYTPYTAQSADLVLMGSFPLSSLTGFASVSTSKAASVAELHLAVHVTRHELMWWLSHECPLGFSDTEILTLYSIFAVCGICDSIVMAVAQPVDEKLPASSLIRHVLNRATYNLPDTFCMDPKEAKQLQKEAAALCPTSMSLLHIPGPSSPSPSEIANGRADGCSYYSTSPHGPYVVSQYIGMTTTLGVGSLEFTLEAASKETGATCSSYLRFLNTTKENTCRDRLPVMEQEDAAVVEAMASHIGSNLPDRHTHLIVATAGYSSALFEAFNLKAAHAIPLISLPQMETYCSINACKNTILYSTESCFLILCRSSPQIPNIQVVLRALFTVAVEHVTFLSRCMSSTQKEGSMLCLSDHINLSGRNPLYGLNNDSWGPRFPDMSKVYTPWPRMTQAIAAYVQGPGIASEAEEKAATRLGAQVLVSDLVPLVIVARHMKRVVRAVVCVEKPTLPHTIQGPVTLTAARMKALSRFPSNK